MFRFSGSSSCRFSRFLATNRGFTLQESLVSLFIGGTLITGGTSLYATLQESSKTAAANDLVSHLNLARSEAIKRHSRATVCPSQDQLTCLEPSAEHAFWQSGWLVYADENSNGKPEAAEIIRVHQPLSRTTVIRTSRERDQVTYQPTGTAGGSTITFAVCDTRGSQSARYVILSNSGRARVSKASTSEIHC